MTEPAPGFHELSRICAARLHGENIAAADFPATDWTALLALAERHRVVPLVAAALGREVPPFHRRALALAQNGIRLEVELASIANMFESAQVAYLLLKGPALARLAYSSPDLRACDDLDLWVATKDVDAAIRGLLAQGYRPDLVAPPRVAAHARRAGIEVALRHPQHERLIEISHGTAALAPAKYMVREIVAQAIRLNIAGVEITTPMSIHALLLACVHGAHHAWDRLGWVADIVGMWHRLTSAEQRQALDCARRWRVGTALGIGLNLAARHLQLHVDSAAHALATTPRVQALADRVELEKMGPTAARADMIRRLRFERDAIDSRGRRIAMQLRWIWVPTLADIRAVPLPLTAYPLYALIRPLRLLRHPWLGAWFRPRA